MSYGFLLLLFSIIGFGVVVFRVNKSILFSIVGLLFIGMLFIRVLEIKENCIPMAFENNETISCYGVNNDVSKKLGWELKDNHFIKNGNSVSFIGCFFTKGSAFEDKLNFKNVLEIK